jgi:hypothetical protein
MTYYVTYITSKSNVYGYNFFECNNLKKEDVLQMQEIIAEERKDKSVLITNIIKLDE